MYKTTNPTVYLETGKLQQSTSGENGGVDSKQVKSSYGKSKSDIFLQKLRFDFWENGQGGLQSWSFLPITPSQLPTLQSSSRFLAFLTCCAPFCSSSHQSPWHTDVWHSIFSSYSIPLPSNLHNATHLRKCFPVLCQFPITVTIYLVRKTSSEKTGPADIINMGLIYNAHFYLTHWKWTAQMALTWSCRYPSYF